MTPSRSEVLLGTFEAGSSTTPRIPLHVFIHTVNIHIPFFVFATHSVCRSLEYTLLVILNRSLLQACSRGFFHRPELRGRSLWRFRAERPSRQNRAVSAAPCSVTERFGCALYFNYILSPSATGSICLCTTSVYFILGLLILRVATLAAP